MNPKVIVAFDLGTTGNRVMAFTRDGTVAAKSYYEFPQIFPQAGWVEHDPQAILKTALQALQDVAGIVGPENIESIGITNQRETSILWDKKTGQPVYNAIVWQDRRTEKMCRHLAVHKELIKQKTGLFLDPYFSATKIAWVINQVPEVKEKIARGEIIFGTPDTWLLWNLTGGKEHATDPSNASRTLLFDITQMRFEPELLRIFDVPAAILPEVKDSDAVFGVLDKKFIGREIPIAGILGDQQAALLAQCGWDEDRAKVTYGTGIFAMANTLGELRHSERLVSTVAWKIGGVVNYALEGSIFIGGAALQWLRDGMKIIEKASDSEQLAASLQDNEGIYFVPALQGLGAPYWDPQARGMIIGLTRKTTRANIARAALEAMAFQVREVVDEMQRSRQLKMAVLRVDGGAAANNFLLQFQADIARIAIERTTMNETTALGAAGVSGLSAKFWSQEEFKKIVSEDRVFKPQLEEKIAAEYYLKWQEAVQRSLHWEQ
ncbi:MAG: glycerol kinase GlpK [bacterium]|nr:glycerol kinase GlpK [bacterium]MDD5353956.1 glycerol kinase GlpK [bacterium]MDD5756219.1 glycerol kinase GlpK [bacterium]